MSDNITDENNAAAQGSWAPLVIILVLLLLRWLFYGTSDIPVRFRRFYNMQRLKLRNQLGMRDDSAYRSGAAGHGASQSVKRQG